MFRPLPGHPKGGLKQKKNTIMADSVKDVNVWGQNYNVLFIRVLRKLHSSGLRSCLHSSNCAVGTV
jgi:hypothetical protein